MSSRWVLALPPPVGHSSLQLETSPREGLDWCIAVKRGDDMVVVFSFDAFTCDQLLAGRLVSFERAPTTILHDLQSIR